MLTQCPYCDKWYREISRHGRIVHNDQGETTARYQREMKALGLG